MTTEDPRPEMNHYDEPIEVLISQLQERQDAHYRLSEQKWKNFEDKWNTFEDNSQHFFAKVLAHDNHIVELNKWQAYLNGVWKAALFICTAVGFLIGVLVQYFK